MVGLDNREGNFGGRSSSTRSSQPHRDERGEQPQQRGHHKNTRTTMTGNTGNTLEQEGYQAGQEQCAQGARWGKQKPGLGGLPQPSEGVWV